MTPKIPLLHYKQQGTGQDVVLIHGLLGSLENLNALAKPLSQQFCVTSVDVRNHGDSFHKNAMAYADLATDIINVLNHLHIKKCVLLGHSMGGKIAMQVALMYPERISKLIVADIAPVQYPPHHSSIIEGLTALDFNKVCTRKDADLQLNHFVDEISIRQFLLRNLTKNSQGKFILKCNIANISHCYQQIMQANKLTDKQKPYQGPTLFIKGGNSDYIQVKHRDDIAKLMPNSRAKIIQGAGHWLHAEKPVAFNKLVIDFLAEV
jgi:esterase